MEEKLNLRKVFIISILVICVIAINLAVYSWITSKPKENIENEEQIVIDKVALTENFNNSKRSIKGPWNVVPSNNFPDSSAPAMKQR